METAIIDYELSRTNNRKSKADGLYNLEQEWAFQLMLDLHASLNIKPMIHQFSNAIQRIVKHDQISYELPRFNLEYHTGKKQEHNVCFHIHSQDLSLGKLCFSRDKAFDFNESLRLEDMMVFLMAPLKNAIEYHAALELAERDPLTQIGNRLAMDRALSRDNELAKRHSTPYSVLALDIDFFKQINDSHGHPAGDAYLKAFTECIQHTIRESDWVFRIGGEEFIVLLGETGPEGAIYLADRLRKKLSALVCDFEKKRITTTTSIGIASYVSGDNPSSVLDRADKALYQAKSQGRNRICL